MAYNSDGYIMIDFTEVDFRRTNQTIDGLYKRCVDVIGTNKFILVINANGRTPLPATCSFTNNQYVIDTCIYMFAISSNDNLFIRRNDVPASDIIDDSSISVDKTWSSNKIDTELGGKQDTLTPVSPVSINADNEISVDLSSKQNVLTPVSPVSINADNEISVDLSSKQDVLTAGNNITIENNVISADQVKQFTYIGDGAVTHDITFPTKPNLVLNIEKHINSVVGICMIPYVETSIKTFGYAPATSGMTFFSDTEAVFNDKVLTLTSLSSNATRALNNNTLVYTVTYI